MPHERMNKILVKDLNSVITCRLCEGYLIDATTLTDCVHHFCRACISRYFVENNKNGCPTCNTVSKKKSQQSFRPDPQMQSLVYKLVPSLYAREMQRREDFYRSTGVRASSSCSDDSVIDRERDMINEQEKMISRCVGDKTQFLSPDDSISLSLEYYQIHLDKTSAKEKNPVPKMFTTVSEPMDISESTVKNSDGCATAINNRNKSDLKSDNASDCKSENNNNNNSVTNEEDNSVYCENKDCDKRFLQCPAAVSMKHLQKFLRMKFGLTVDHRVDIIYKGEVLPIDFSLMDVAYTFNWKRVKPLRFFYRIFTPMKIRPIKIINTTLSTGGKQLQVVSLKSSLETVKVIDSESDKTENKDSTNDKTIEQQIEREKLLEKESTEDKKKELFAHLQLKSKTPTEKQENNTQLSNSCLFDYEEPDQEEIKKFAENRDREWALQKKLDETRRQEEEEYNSHHFTKKRKKSKHSKNEFNVHKKRKLHAEIASNDDAELKLKVKITNNGHKHKHHKNSGQNSSKMQNSDVSSKEKLLQMRQIRHKQMVSEDKNIQTGASYTLPKDSTNGETIIMDVIKNCKNRSENKEESPKYSPKLHEDVKKLKIKVPEPSTRVTESAVLPKQQTESTNTSPKLGTFPEPPATKSPIKSSVDKDSSKKVPTVQIERNEQTEKHAQKTFLKTFPTNSEKHKVEKILNKPETATISTQIKTININKPPMKTDIKSDINKMHTNKLLERKFASLQYQCTIEPKHEKKSNPIADKPKTNFSTPHYPPGFTVSKIEQGVKRKVDDQEIQDKRPSLEITLINPPTAPAINNKPMEKTPTVKRPPPATIPLEKIKKSVNHKSGISIIPKMPERCDNIGALDLSKPSKSPDILPKNSMRPESAGSLTKTTNRQLSALSRTSNTPNEKNNMALSNLQMLSKVATEHSNSNGKPNQIMSMNANKPKPQLPNLQTLKIPLPQNQNQTMKNPGLQKLPKLNEIQKFRPTNLQIRNMRPNPNQNIRNIPNPSLLNQNRLHSQINIQHNNNSENSKTASQVTITSSTTTTPTSSIPKESPTTIKILESKIQEKKEILV